jgi:hypothetical protein
MARKRQVVEEEVDLEEDEVGTQQPQPSNHGVKPMDDTSKMSPLEVRLKKQRELENEQREAASKEYEEKMAEAEEKIAKEYEESGEPRPEDPDKPPEACAQFEGYGEFTVPGEVNIRHQDKKKGDTVALTWEDYQALRDQKIYCEPVPVPEQQPEHR